MDNGNYCDKSEESQDNNVVPMTILFDNLSTNSPPELNLFYEKERNECSKLFEKWPEHDQTDFVQNLLNRMTHFQHSQINFFLSPMLQRDFVTLLPQKGLDYIAEKILGYLDGKSLCNAELVCKHWHHVISERMLWKKLIEHNVKTNYLWRELSKRRGWANYLFKNCLVDEESPDQRPDHWFYRRLYPQIIKDIENMEKNWRNGLHTTQKINCRSEASKGVYCLQYDDKQIISGLRDNTIKIWSRNDLQCKRVLTGHTGSVLCLQFDENVIVSGSSDATVRIWDIETGQLRSTLIHHSEAVLHLRFSNGLMVTCSKDRSIAVWDMNPSNDIVLRRVLMGHRAAVNVVDFDEKYIVSASGDRSIKVWNTSNCEFVRTLVGHKRGIACLQYRDNLVVSGSSDNTIRLWDVEEGVCLRVLEGHEELVRCIRFDKKRIVSGAYDGKIKVWDLKAALDQKSNESLLCLKTIVEHTGRVFRLQFDQFQIVSSSHDDTICIMDFLGSEPDNFKLPPLRKVGYLNGINSSNGNGAKSKQKNLNNGSMTNKDFGKLLLSTFSFKLEPNQMESSTPNNFNKTEYNSLLFDNQPVSVNVNIDKPMQSNLPINNLNQELVDQEMTNSNEFCILSEFNNQAPVNSSNENQGFEIMDTQKIVDTIDNNHQQTTPSTTNNNSPTLSNSSFNNFLINQHPQQGSANTSKLNNITNLTNQLNSTNNNHDNQLVDDLTAINNNLNSSNAELSNSNGTNINNHFKGLIPLFKKIK